LSADFAAKSSAIFRQIRGLLAACRVPDAVQRFFSAALHPGNVSAPYLCRPPSRHAALKHAGAIEGKLATRY
jgi:hypothetical protein